jgi:hypothetical protein
MDCGRDLGGVGGGDLGGNEAGFAIVLCECKDEFRYTVSAFRCFDIKKEKE